MILFVSSQTLFPKIFLHFNRTIMDNINKEAIQQFLSVNEISLRCTQAKLCIPIINRMYQKMVIGIKFSGIKVEDKLICDGHHRYFASLLANYNIEQQPYITTGATSTTEWKNVDFVEENWDTQAKIDILNEQDAKFNNITVEQLIHLIN